MVKLVPRYNIILFAIGTDIGIHNTHSIVITVIYIGIHYYFKRDFRTNCQFSNIIMRW